MSIRLRSGLSWCICAQQAVFLDLARDRYFVLSEPLDRVFKRWAGAEAISVDDAGALIESGVAELGDGPRPVPADHPIAASDYACDRGARPASYVPTAIVSQMLARRWLKRLTLEGALARVATPRVDGTRDQNETRKRRIARAFAASALLLHSADQCLPRAIAARHLCNRHGQQAALIFGVRLGPFAAHSWLQSGDAVMVGDLEQVRLYTPILVIP